MYYKTDASASHHFKDAGIEKVFKKLLNVNETQESHNLHWRIGPVLPADACNELLERIGQEHKKLPQK